MNLHSTDFDHQLSMVQAQLHALMESVNRLAELKANAKSATFELPITRKELAAKLERSVWTVDAMTRAGKIKKHFLPGTSTPVYYLSEVQGAIKRS